MTHVLGVKVNQYRGQPYLEHRQDRKPVASELLPCRYFLTDPTEELQRKLARNEKLPRGVPSIGLMVMLWAWRNIGSRDTGLQTQTGRQQSMWCILDDKSTGKHPNSPRSRKQNAGKKIRVPRIESVC